MTKQKIVVLDLFAGAGGLSCGFKKAGFDVCAHLEYDKYACGTLRKNFKRSEVIEEDISKVDPIAVQHRIGKKIDVIVGGPPCQGFSLVGKAKLRSLGVHDDPRNKMYKQFLRFVDVLKPCAVVMENVPAILRHDGGRTSLKIQEHFDQLGYNVNVMLLNAADYGVPQTRKRAFFVAIRKDLHVQFAVPKRTHVDPNTKTMRKKFWRTVKEAISDLPPIPPGALNNKIKHVMPAAFSYQKNMRKSAKTVYNHITRSYGKMDLKIFSIMHQGMKYYQLPSNLKRYRDDSFRDKYKRLMDAHPSWTVVAHLQKDGYMYIHPSQDRTISPREAARLQSFHDGFVFVGPMTQQFKQIGNAVPPLLAYSIAKSLYKTMRVTV